MNKWIYPAYFKRDRNNIYSVNIPDLEIRKYMGTASIYRAMNEITEAVYVLLIRRIEEDGIIPEATDINELATNNDYKDTGFLSYIVLDLDEYTRIHGSYAVKKTLTIPAWLNSIAEEKNINFSRVLQKALKEEVKQYEPLKSI